MQNVNIYDGTSFDELLYPQPERTIIATHNGPTFAKFTNPRPTIQVTHLLNQVNDKLGNNNNTITGNRSLDLDWFPEHGFDMVVSPQGRLGTQEVEWTQWLSNYGIDSRKSGFLCDAVEEWLLTAGLSDIDPVWMLGVLDSMPVKETYTFMFAKAVLTLRTVSVGYSVEGTEFKMNKECIGYIQCESKQEKLRQLGNKDCTIDIDDLSYDERFVAMASAAQYPSIECNVRGRRCAYSCLILPKCSVCFVGSVGLKAVSVAPTPDRWWKATVGLAVKLGAVDDLVDAFRMTRGWASWMSGMGSFGTVAFDMQVDCPPTRGGRSVLTGLSNIGSDRSDQVDRPTDLACSLGELVCDWAVGSEMVAMLFHLSDEFGLGNKEANRTINGTVEGSMVDSLLLEARMYRQGPENAFYSEVYQRFGTKVRLLGNDDLKALIREVGGFYLNWESPELDRLREQIINAKRPVFTAFFGPLWHANGTNAIGKTAKIDCMNWRARLGDKYALRNWLDMYGLSDEVLFMSGYNAVQKMGLEEVTRKSMDDLMLPDGEYREVYRKTNWKSTYTTRIGSKTSERDSDAVSYAIKWLNLDD